MSQNPLLESTKSYARELGYDLPEMAVHAIRRMIGHSYYIWKTMRREFGPDKGYEFYYAMVIKLTAGMVPGAAAFLGIEEVKDIPTLGKIIERGLTTFPVLYETVRNDKDVHVGRVPWCLNPTYGPCDSYVDRQAYFRHERDVTIDPFLKGYVQYAKEHGLKEDVEIDCPQARCTNADACFCEYVIRRKGTPEIKSTTPPVEEKSFIEFDIGDEEPLLYILKKQGRTVEDQLPLTFLGYFLYDSAAYDTFEERLGKEKGLELYYKLWLLAYPADWTKEARLELEIGRTKSLEELAKIIAFCEKRRFTSYQLASKGDNQVILSGTTDPFVEMSTKFLGKEVGGNYLKAMASANQEFINQVVSEAKMAGVVKATLTRALARGDDKNEIVIERK